MRLVLTNNPDYFAGYFFLKANNKAGSDRRYEGMIAMQGRYAGFEDGWSSGIVI